MPHRYGFRSTALLFAAVLLIASAFAQAPRTALPSNELRHSPRDGQIPIKMGQLNAISVASGFVYVGGRRFLLTPTVEAEQLLFVDADQSKKVRRLIWIQVESRTPADSGTYDYSADMAKTVQGLPLRVSARRYSTPPEVASDRGSAYRIVESAGYTMPAGAARLRLIYLPEQPARREVMVVYVETDEGGTATPELEPLLERALRAIRLESGT